ncbi:MAG: glutathione S-transferase family protein [Deltaproteobacteria bacterium]|nr:glutathione S-transferase family protein [Deltaproteobacteria bacterium]
MKMYNLMLSNFASKSRVAIYEKGLNVEFVDPPGGLGSAEYKKVNPLGKVPALDIGGGQLIAESEVINEYLEDKFPEKPLLPKDPEGRARVRSFTRHHDLYLEPPLRALFPQLSAKPRDTKLVEEKLADINNRLDQVEAMLSNGPWAIGDMFTLADAALTPTTFFAVNFLPAFGAKSPFEGRPKLKAWWDHIQERPSTKKVLGEQQAALNAMMKR